MSRLDRSWDQMAAALALSSLAAWWLPAPLIDWQPARAWTEPWRAFSGALVHWDLAHLGTNLIGTAMVAALGRLARLTAPAMLAWATAWPLTQVGLLMQPALTHYGGLSGVLHAGVAVAVLWLLARESGQRRAIGVFIGSALIAKLLLEEPWGLQLRQPGDAANDGSGVVVAPLAHATGAVAGLLCAAVALALDPRRCR